MKPYTEPATVAAPIPLDEFLRQTWPQASGKQIKTWIKHRSVSINDAPMWRFNQPLKKGDIIRIRSDRYVIEETKLPSGLTIRHEDASILVVEKPSGLLTIATDQEKEKTVYFKLNAWLESRNPFQPERVWIVHRLDRETSGLLLFAKSEKAKATLQKNWDQFEKRYVVVVEGIPRVPERELVDLLDESDDFKVRIARQRTEDTRQAITRYKVVKSSGNYSLLDVEILTGRRHQIRVQMAAQGHPVAGDERYGAKTDPIRRLALHAAHLIFNHPVSGKKMEFRCANPTSFKTIFRPEFDHVNVRTFKNREELPGRTPEGKPVPKGKTENFRSKRPTPQDARRRPSTQNRRFRSK